MTHRLATNCAKNYCNRTLIVKVIVENVVTCFFGTRCIVKLGGRFLQKLRGCITIISANLTSFILTSASINDVEFADEINATINKLMLSSNIPRSSCKNLPPYFSVEHYTVVT